MRPSSLSALSRARCYAYTNAVYTEGSAARMLETAPDDNPFSTLFERAFRDRPEPLVVTTCESGLGDGLP